MYGVVYKITNNISGKSYVGQTKRDVKVRFREHSRCKTTILGKAIHSYGIENFSIEIIEKAETRQELDEKEIYYIKLLNTIKPNGYNQCKGGEGVSGMVWTQEMREHARETHVGKNCGKDNPMYGKCGELNPFYGKKHSEKTKRMLSEKAKENYSGANNPMYGRKHTEEALKKMSENRKGKHCGKEHSLYGKHLSDETKEKLSKAKKGKEFPGKWKPVICVETNTIYPSVKEAAKAMNIKPSSISTVLSGRRAKTAGYHWTFANDEGR